MQADRSRWSLLAFCLACLFCAASTGCTSCHPDIHSRVVDPDTAHELEKQFMPAYVIEPPDILLIDAVRVVPLPPYKVQPLDGLFIQSTNTLPNEPINGVFGVEPDGTVNLGPSYGAVRLAGMTTEEAKAAVEKQLKLVLKDPKVVVALAQSRAMQQIRGEHLVRPDGTVGLGVYGSVPIGGLTLEAAKALIEEYLSQHLLKPEISIDVYSYNSKFYYVVLDGGGYGQQIYRLPITGNETVLDALSLINGLPAVSSTHKIWVARPTNSAGCPDQVMPVDWPAVVQCGSARTNYQLFPGDRVYVKADCLISTDNWIAKVVAPIERLLGVTLLAQQVINPNRNGNGNGNGF